MVTKEPNIKWIPNGKEVIEAYSDDNYLGFFQYEFQGKHKHWKWFQSQGIGLTGSFLEEVRQKQKELWKTRGNNK